MNRVVEIDERVTAEGEVLTPVDLAGARAGLAAAYARRHPLGRDRVPAWLSPHRP